jgi:hypothetical protein
MIIVRPRLIVRILPAAMVCLWLLSGVRRLEAQSDNQENSLQPAATTAKEVLRGIRDSLSRIRSIHYTFESTYFSAIRASQPARTTKTDAEFAFDNGKFYSSLNGNSTSGSKWFETSAFDGSKYQRYDGRLLIVSSEMPEQPYGALQPVTHPFLFAWTRDTGRLSFEVISKQESWDEIANRSKLESSEMVNGHPCDVISFTTQPDSSPKHDVFWKVYAARDLGYYPVRETTVNGNYSSVLDVTEWTVVPNAKGDVVVPIKIVSESRQGEHLVQSKSYDVRLISVNEEVNESLFSLMRFKPERVKHVD